MKATEKCLERDEMIDYFEMKLSEDRLEEIEEHFATCEFCIAEARVVHEALLAVAGWTAESHGEAYRLQTVTDALVQAEQLETRADWKARLGRWRKSVTEAAAGGLELLIDASGARLIPGTLEALVQSGGLQFEPVGARRAQSATGKAPPIRAVLSHAEPESRVTITAGEKVEVFVKSWPADLQPPGILVIDAAGKRAAKVIELRPGHATVIPDLEEGEYLIMFAPQEKKN